MRLCGHFHHGQEALGEGVCKEEYVVVGVNVWPGAKPSQGCGMLGVKGDGENLGLLDLISDHGQALAVLNLLFLPLLPGFCNPRDINLHQRHQHVHLCAGEGLPQSICLLVLISDCVCGLLSGPEAPLLSFRCQD